MNKYCIEKNYTIKETIERIEEGKDRGVIVLGKDKKVIGVVSQGDIIRGIISGKDIYSHVDTIVKPSFFYLNDKDLEKAYKLFKKYKISLLPVVDDDFKLTDVINMDDIYSYLEDQCKN